MASAVHMMLLAGYSLTGTVRSETGTPNNDSLAGITTRLVYKKAGLIVPNKPPSRVRLTLGASSTTSCTIGSIYIGHKSGTSGFTATPVQFHVSGSNSFTIPTNSEVVTDFASFAWDRVTDLLISFYQLSGNNRFYGTVDANTLNFFKTGDDAANTSPTGYSSGSVLDLVRVIEMDGF